MQLVRGRTHLGLTHRRLTTVFSAFFVVVAVGLIVVAIAITSATVKAATTPTAYWTLDETSGTRYDSVGTNHLSVTGTVGTTVGQVGNAANIPNTAGNYFSIADNAAISTGGETSFTFSMWVKLNNKASTQVFVGKYGGGSGEYAVYYEQAFKRFVFSTYSAPSANNYVLANGIGEPSTGVWYHITAIHDAAANTNSITVNGATNSISNVPEHVDTSANLYIGAFNGAGQYPAQAAIDEVRFYKTALSPEEVEDISEPPSNLIGHWKFDEGTGSITADTSGNGHTGTITNATFSTTVPAVAFTNPYSMYFNPVNSGRIVTTDLQLNELTEFTVAGWAYPTAATNRASWFGQNDMVEFGFTDSNTLFCYTAKGEASWDFNPSTFLNNWHNITCLGSPTTLAIYIDGVNVASTSVTAGSYGSSSDFFSIGAGAVDGGTSGPFSGYIDDVRVYNRALTPEEMNGLGTGQAGPGGPDVPAVSITTPSSDVAYGIWNPMVDWGDADQCAYSWNNSSWSTVDCLLDGTNIPEPAEEENITLYVRANYTGSNDYGIASSTFSYDTTDPIVNAGDDISANVSFAQNTATASDTGTGITTYSWGKQSGPGAVNFSNTAILQPTITAISIDGTYVLRLTVTDAAGNSAYDDITVVWDTTAPTVPGRPSVGGSHSADNTPVWSWTASTDSGSGLAFIAYSVQWSQDTSFFGLGGQAGVTDHSYEIPEGLTMTDSTWHFRVKAIDGVGNESDWSDYGTVHIDTSIPTISDLRITDGTSLTNKVITWETNEATSSVVTYGPTIGMSTATTETDISPRVTSHVVELSDLLSCSIYYLTVTSRDAAGNQATSATQSFTIDGCAGSSEILSYQVYPVSKDTGQTITLDSTTVTVPAGFASADAAFQIKQISYNLLLGTIGMPSGQSPARLVVYDIKALQSDMSQISSFDQAITITLPYDQTDTASLIESSLAIYRWDDATGWNKLNDCRVDVLARTVTCTTDHFSTFALFGQKKSAVLAVSNTVSVNDTIPPQEELPRSDSNQVTARADTEEEGNGAIHSDQSAPLMGIVIIIGSLVLVGGCFWLILVKKRRGNEEDDKRKQ